MDTETGMYYLMSRYYDPVTHRFVNADSQLNPGTGLPGFNVFAYANNNPVMYSDPDGHSILALIGLAVLAAGILIGFSGDTASNNVAYSQKNQTVDPKKKPNPESGYKPPKKNKNPQKVKNPNGNGRGWPSDDGGVWIPDNTQHGGPGWTVQYPDGSHEHRYPDGHVRTHEFKNDNTFEINNYILGASMIVGSGVGIVLLTVDDATVIGIMDDAAIPVLCGVLVEGVQMIAG